MKSRILTSKFLKIATIRKEEKILVLTGINYENRESKTSLKGFKGEGVCFKRESAFLIENKRLYYQNGLSGLKQIITATREEDTQVKDLDYIDKHIRQHNNGDLHLAITNHISSRI